MRSDTEVHCAGRSKFHLGTQWFPWRPLRGTINQRSTINQSTKELRNNLWNKTRVGSRINNFKPVASSRPPGHPYTDRDPKRQVSSGSPPFPQCGWILGALNRFQSPPKIKIGDLTDLALSGSSSRLWVILFADPVTTEWCTNLGALAVLPVQGTEGETSRSWFDAWWTDGIFWWEIQSPWVLESYIMTSQSDSFGRNKDRHVRRYWLA